MTIVCTGGEEAPESRARVWFPQARYIFAADGGLVALHRLRHKADVWVGDGDSLPGGVERWRDHAREFVVLATEKDETDTEAAVRLALERDPTEVWLLGGSGGRMDHWWSNVRLLAREPRVARWLTAHEDIVALSPGQTAPLLPGTVSIFPVGEGPWKVRSQGLQWSLDIDYRAWHSLSNVAGANASVTVDQGRFLLLCPHGDRP